MKEVETLRKSADVSTVDSAVVTIQTLLTKPPELFDPYSAIAALESLVDIAREKGDARASRFGIVLRQCRPLLTDGNLQAILIKLIASKEEAEVAKASRNLVRKQMLLKILSLVGRDPLLLSVGGVVVGVDDLVPRQDAGPAARWATLRVDAPTSVFESPV